MRSGLCVFIVFLCSVIFVETGVSKKTPLIMVSILPQKYFVQQIAKDLVTVEVMVLPGDSPATYEPKPAQMVKIATADIYFSIGVPFEQVWLQKLVSANPKLIVVPTDHGIPKLVMSTAHHFDDDSPHAHLPDPSAAPSHEKGRDPHIWLSPPLVMLQARMMLTALQETDPIHRAEYEANYKEFMLALLALDTELRNTFFDKQGTRFMVFHPSWGYFAHTYGLRQIPIEIEGKNPKPAQLAALIDEARMSGIKAIFVQPQFSTKNANQIASAIQGTVIVADPLASDWLENLRHVGVLMNDALK